MIASGTLGTCNWDIDDNGVFTIHSGELYWDATHYVTYSAFNYNHPWYEYASDVTAAVIESGVTIGYDYVEALGGTVSRSNTSKEVLTQLFCNMLYVTSITINSPLAGATSHADMFSSCTSLTTLDVSMLDTSASKNMSGMFYNCPALTALDCSTFDTSNVTTMGKMFYYGTNLTSLDISTFNTSSCHHMSYMFYACMKLTELDVSSFNTSAVYTMDGMFNYCTAVTSLDLSNFNTSNVETMYQMFWCCYKLTYLNVSSFDTSNVIDDGWLTINPGMEGMFAHCEALRSLDITNFDITGVQSISQMFSGCTSLESIDLCSFDTSNITDMSYLFSACTNLLLLDLSSFDTSNVTTMFAMFKECSNLISLDVTHFDTSSVTNMMQMFDNCQALTTLDVSNFDTSNATNMYGMFASCSSLNTVDISNFDTSKVTNMGAMFSFSHRMSNLDLSHLNTSKVTKMTRMFASCRSLSSLDISNFDTSKVTDMEGMFYNCAGLSTLDLSHFDTTRVTDMSEMFRSCNNLVALDISSFDTSQVTDIRQMFQDASALTSLNLSNFNTSSVTRMDSIFTGMTMLSTLILGNSFDISAVISPNTSIGLVISGNSIRNSTTGTVVNSDLDFMHLSASDKAGTWLRGIEDTFFVTAVRTSHDIENPDGTDVRFQIRWATSNNLTDRIISIYQKNINDPIFSDTPVYTETETGQSGINEITLANIGDSPYDFRVTFYDGETLFAAFPAVASNVKLFDLDYETGTGKFTGNVIDGSNNILAYKANIYNPSFSGVVKAQAISLRANTGEYKNMIDFFYPVGSYYETSDTTFNPNAIWGGTWVLETEGQVHISSGINYTVNGASTNTTDGGTTAHTHSLDRSDNGTGYVDAIATGTTFYENFVTVPNRTMALKWAINSQQTSTNSTTYAIPLKGSTASNSSLPPYIVVNRWHRTA